MVDKRLVVKLRSLIDEYGERLVRSALKVAVVKPKRPAHRPMGVKQSDLDRDLICLEMANSLLLRDENMSLTTALTMVAKRSTLPSTVQSRVATLRRRLDRGECWGLKTMHIHRVRKGRGKEFFLMRKLFNKLDYFHFSRHFVGIEMYSLNNMRRSVCCESVFNDKFKKAIIAEDVNLRNIILSYIQTLDEKFVNTEISLLADIINLRDGGEADFEAFTIRCEQLD